MGENWRTGRVQVVDALGVASADSKAPPVAAIACELVKDGLGVLGVAEVEMHPGEVRVVSVVFWSLDAQKRGAGPGAEVLEPGKQLGGVNVLDSAVAGGKLEMQVRAVPTVRQVTTSPEFRETAREAESGEDVLVARKLPVAEHLGQRAGRCGGRGGGRRRAAPGKEGVQTRAIEGASEGHPHALHLWVLGCGERTEGQ